VTEIELGGRADAHRRMEGTAPVAADEPQTWGAACRRLATEAGGAESVLVAPLRTARERYGLLVVFLRRSSLFLEDDLAHLGLLAEEAALALSRLNWWSSSASRTPPWRRPAG